MYQIEKHIVEKLKVFFEQYSYIDKVVVFGSRAKHTANEKSDIDLSIYSQEMSSRQFSMLKMEIDELPILYKLDVVHFESSNEELQENIRKDGKLLYRKFVKLKEIGKIVTGKTPSKKEAIYWDSNDIPFVKPDDFANDVSILKKFNTYVSYLGSEKTNIIPKNSVLVTCIGTIGKVVINDTEVATNQQINSVIPNEKIDSKYLMYQILQKRTYLNHIANAAVVPIINKSTFEKIEIFLPPLKTQKNIANTLDQAKALIELRQQSIEKLDELAKSVFIDMFGDPVENPHQFEVRLLSDFFSDKKDGTKCGPFGSILKKEEYVKDGIPVWNMDNITKKGDFIDSKNLMIDETKFTQLSNYKTLNGDIIISRAGTVGKMCVVNSKYDRSIISTNLIRLRFNSELLPLYFVKLMTYCKDRLKRLEMGKDGALTHMSTKILSTLEFPYPPLELQQKFAQTIQKIEAQKALYEQQLTKLQEQFDALLARSFEG